MFLEANELSNILVIAKETASRRHLDLMFNGDENASINANSENLSYVFHGCDNRISAIAILKNGLKLDSPYHLALIHSEVEQQKSLELISQLWQIDADLQVVLFNSDPELSWQQIIDTLGESDQLLIFSPPFSDLELRQLVHAMMRKWQLSRQFKNVMQYMELQINERTQTIKETHQQLLQAEKLAAVGQLASGIAHEINTPAQYVGDNIVALKDFLASMIRLMEFYRQLLSKNSAEDLQYQIKTQEQTEDLEFILEDAPQAIEQSLEGIAQIVRIVQAMKGFSHISQSNATNININLALENTLLVARSSYKSIADIETQFNDIPNIECFPGELNQVFLNILVNAVHAIEDANKGRGKITISTHPIAEGIEIKFIDTGIGISETIREHIYDPFFTTKAVGRGTGQGLNIAYRIVHQQHGGHLNFVSEPGMGTTFIISLLRKLPDKAEEN